MSPRIALKIEYLGKKFCGSQSQNGVRTVQTDLENALTTYLRSKPTKVIFAGRTDTGVHAKGQVVHFDYLDEEIETFRDDIGNLDLFKLCQGLNGILKEDVSIIAAQGVDDTFHARFSAYERTYVYKILNRRQRSALYSDTHYFVPQALDWQKMAHVVQYLVGNHDFLAFKSTNSDTVTSICQVNETKLLNLGEGELEFWISANHFVYNMVRIIVGTIVEIGLNKRSSTSLAEALTKLKRDAAGPTAPAWGLCLHSIQYPKQFELFEKELFGE